VIEYKDVFRFKLGTDPPGNMKPLVIKLRDGAEPVRMSAPKYAPSQLKLMRDKKCELKERAELGLQEHWSRVGDPRSSVRILGPTSIP
jgi:hypothetical protein